MNDQATTAGRAYDELLEKIEPVTTTQERPVKLVVEVMGPIRALTA